MTNEACPEGLKYPWQCPRCLAEGSEIHPVPSIIRRNSDPMPETRNKARTALEGRAAVHSASVPYDFAERSGQETSFERMRTPQPPDLTVCEANALKVKVATLRGYLRDALEDPTTLQDPEWVQAVVEAIV